MEYSIVVPVYNEEESLPVLWEEIKGAMQQLNGSYEVIFVDDGSTDKTPEILSGFQNDAPAVAKVLSLPRHGQTYAMKQGLDAAHGKIVMTLDADLQNDPADIPRLIAKMNMENCDVVCGWRKARRDKPLKAILSKLGNVLQRLLTGMAIHDVSCTLRAYKRECVSAVALNWEGQHRFIPLSLSLQGYKVREIISNHRQRRYGISKYSHKRIFKVIVDFFRILAAGGKK